MNYYEIFCLFLNCLFVATFRSLIWLYKRGNNSFVVWQ